MLENQSTFQELSSDESEISLFDLLIILAKYKKMILVIIFAAALFAITYSLRLPNIYTATTKILPPQSSQSTSPISALMQSQLGGLAGVASGLLGANPNALYVALMKSRNITEKIVRRFDLQKVYDEGTMTGALKMLENNTVIFLAKDGVISVSVTDVDAHRAAALANAYFEELEKLTQTMAISEVSKRRLFLEQQMKSAKDRLTDSEILLDKTLPTSLQYKDVVRNFKYQEVLYEMLAKQFEVAKLEEARDAQLVQVLDKAVDPEISTGPKRKNIVVFVTLGGALLAIILAFILESKSRLKGNPEHERRRALLRSYLSLK